MKFMTWIFSEYVGIHSVGIRKKASRSAERVYCKLINPQKKLFHRRLGDFPT